MSTTMLVGMAIIPLGLALSSYGLLPSFNQQQIHRHTLHFHVADNVPLNSEHWKLVCVLFVAVAVDVMKPATLGFVMPGMTQEYGISSKTAGWLALVALTGTAIGSIIWGSISDYCGRRAAILLSALMFIGTAICGAMPAFSWNIAMCFLMGLSAGGLLPITFTLMAETIPANHRGWLLVTLGSIGTGAGFLLASGSAALLEPLFSWRSLWLLGLPTGLLVIALNKYIPESPRYLARKGFTDEARQVLSRFSGSLSSQPENIVEEYLPEEKWELGKLLTGSYAGITAGLIGTGLSWGIVNFGFLLWLPTNFRKLGLGQQTDTVIAQAAIFALPCIALVIWLYHRWNSIYTLVLFVILTSVSLLLFSVSQWLNLSSSLILFLATTLLLMCASAVIAMLIPYAAEIYPLKYRGTGTGIIAGSSKLGGIFGAILGVAGFYDNMSTSALAIAVLLFVSAAVLLRSGIDTRGLRLEEIQGKLNTGNIVNTFDSSEAVIEMSSPTCYLTDEDFK